jgi:hypothetical protein
MLLTGLLAPHPYGIIGAKKPATPLQGAVEIKIS